LGLAGGGPGGLPAELGGLLAYGESTNEADNKAIIRDFLM